MPTAEDRRIFVAKIRKAFARRRVVRVKAMLPRVRSSETLGSFICPDAIGTERPPQKNVDPVAPRARQGLLELLCDDGQASIAARAAETGRAAIAAIAHRSIEVDDRPGGRSDRGSSRLRIGQSPARFRRRWLRGTFCATGRILVGQMRVSVLVVISPATDSWSDESPTPPILFGLGRPDPRLAQKPINLFPGFCLR